MAAAKAIAKKASTLRMAELEMLETVFGNQSKVAELLAVNRSRVSKWHKGEFPDDQNRLKLAAINYLLTILLSHMKPGTVMKWFNGINAHLNNQRPLDLLKQNKIPEVIDAAYQSAAGAYA